MQRITRFFLVLLVGVFFMGISSLAEEITLTTYYPAPYGAYEELTTTGDTYLATDSGNVGIGTTAPAATLEINNSNAPFISFKRGTVSSIMGQTMDGGFAHLYNSTGTLTLQLDAGTGHCYFNNTGNVGIDIAIPTASLHVNGNIKAVLSDIADFPVNQKMYYEIGGELGYDIAELFETTEEVELGDLLVIDETKDIQLRKSNTPYEKGVVGIVSGSPAILFEGSQLEIAPAPGGFTNGKKPPVALTGRIPCKVSIENGPIGRGDLLTSSSVPGHAMKATDRDKSFGAIVGKALEPFDGGPDGEETGKIVILVTLQ